MAEQILQVKNLTKSYRRNAVVDNFSLSVEKGHICGLIGPNGAGKTTIMKILAGLTLPESGNIRFFGDSNLDTQRKRMSFMIENPMLDGAMTARQNLEYMRYLRGVADEKRISSVLEFVGLDHTDKKKVSKFSLGMKQRLAIAIALLSSPEIMVFDEPTNGVDPQGIVDMRNMMKKLCDEYNVTILVSSHILSEMAELCTDFAIINNGRLLEELSSDKLAAKCRNHITLKTNNQNKTVFILEKKLGIKNYRVIHSNEIHIFEHLNEIEKISKTITDNGITLIKLNFENESLEEYYISKVGGVQ